MVHGISSRLHLNPATFTIFHSVYYYVSSSAFPASFSEGRNGSDDDGRARLRSGGATALDASLAHPVPILFRLLHAVLPGHADHHHGLDHPQARCAGLVHHAAHSCCHLLGGSARVPAED